MIHGAKLVGFLTTPHSGWLLNDATPPHTPSDTEAISDYTVAVNDACDMIYYNMNYEDAIS